MKYYSIMSSRINPKETLYFKVPTYIVDLIIHFSVFYLCLSCSDLIPLSLKSLMSSTGVPLILLICYAIAISLVGIHLNAKRISYYKVILRAIAQTCITITLYIFLISAVYKITPLRFYLLQGAVALGLVIIAHVIIRYIIICVRKSGRNRLRVVMVGSDENLVTIYHEMKVGYGIHGYAILGFFTDKYHEQVPEGEKVLGGVDDVLPYLRTHEVDEIYCAINPSSNKPLVDSIIQEAENSFIQFWFVPNMNGYPRRRMKYEEFGSVNVIYLREEPMNNPVMKLFKRSEDILISGLFLITLYPVIWLFVAIGIKLSSPGPILFRQNRTGYNGKSFKCLKFRSMKVNADSDKVQATEHDPRKTKFGDFLRRTSIDELPQFINVFKGDMSLVGPRPHMEFHTEMYSRLISEYMVRHLVKPGITGWAQVNGCRGETKTVEQMKERVEHDIWYIEHWSPMLDVKIVFMTVCQILGGDKQAY